MLLRTGHRTPYNMARQLSFSAWLSTEGKEPRSCRRVRAHVVTSDDRPAEDRTAVSQNNKADAFAFFRGLIGCPLTTESPSSSAAAAEILLSAFCIFVHVRSTRSHLIVAGQTRQVSMKMGGAIRSLCRRSLQPEHVAAPTESPLSGLRFHLGNAKGSVVRRQKGMSHKIDATTVEALTSSPHRSSFAHS